MTEEADETLGWIELIAELELAGGAEMAWLLTESRELVAIFASGYATANDKEHRRSPIARSPIR